MKCVGGGKRCFNGTIDQILERSETSCQNGFLNLKHNLYLVYKMAQRTFDVVIYSIIYLSHFITNCSKSEVLEINTILLLKVD